MLKKGDIVVCVDPAHGLVRDRRYKIIEIEEGIMDNFVTVEDLETGEENDGIYINRFELVSKSKKNNSSNYI